MGRFHSLVVELSDGAAGQGAVGLKCEMVELRGINLIGGLGKSVDCWSYCDDPVHVPNVYLNCVQG